MAKPMSQLAREAPAALSFQTPRTVPSARAFNALLASRIVQHSDVIVIRSYPRDAAPMLKTWLDDNLPAIVERLVCAEIERVARGE